MQSAPPKPLMIVGAGGHAREMVWLAQACPEQWTVLGCLDDDPKLQGTEMCGVPVLGRVEEWRRWQHASFVVALGAPRTRLALVRRMESQGTPDYATLVHPSVIRSPYVSIGEGSMVGAGCILTTHVKLGRHTLLNLNCSVSHDCVLEDYSTVAPGVAVPGNVHMEAGSELAIGAVLRQGLGIGRGAFVGMGAVVTKAVAARDLVIGCPARPVRQLDAF